MIFWYNEYFFFLYIKYIHSAVVNEKKKVCMPTLTKHKSGQHVFNVSSQLCYWSYFMHSTVNPSSSLCGHSPVPTITWRKINGNIPKKARLRKSQAVLEIPNIQLEDSGTYECKAENPRGGTAFKGHLQVYSEWEHALIHSCFISPRRNCVCSLLTFSGTKFIMKSQVSIPRSWTVHIELLSSSFLFQNWESVLFPQWSEGIEVKRIL